MLQMLVWHCWVLRPKHECREHGWFRKNRTAELTLLSTKKSLCHFGYLYHILSHLSFLGSEIESSFWIRIIFVAILQPTSPGAPQLARPPKVWALPRFWVTVNPISTRGTDYAHHSTMGLVWLKFVVAPLYCLQLVNFHWHRPKWLIKICINKTKHHS